MATFTGDHESAHAFLRDNGCTVVIAGALLAEADQTGYVRHQLSGRSVVVKLDGPRFVVRTTPSGLPYVPAHLR